jgi:hypothetical protein
MRTPDTPYKNKRQTQTAEELAEMANEFPEEEWYSLVQEELEAIKELPFATAIKHVLMP